MRNHTYQMLNLLAQDRPRGEAPRGPILELVAAEDVLERLLGWQLQGEPCEERKVEQLKLYEMLISQARQPLLRHRAVLTPLLRLLGLCAEPGSAALENSLVLLLSQLCASAAQEPAVLELFFHSPADQGPANLIFSLLIPFIHHEGVLGQQARDALLLIMAMSAGNLAVASSITDNSYFCPVRRADGAHLWLGGRRNVGRGLGRDTGTQGHRPPRLRTGMGAPFPWDWGWEGSGAGAACTETPASGGQGQHSGTGDTCRAVRGQGTQAKWRGDIGL